MKRYAQVGTSYRGYMMYASNLVKEFGDCAELVGLCDLNPKRAAVYNSELGTNIPIFTDFEEMINTVKPDVVIVTTIDRWHHEYIIKAMEMGCDVISEKPLTIDAEKYKLIAEAKERTGRELTVTFNLRFAPFPYRVKELISEGVIGDILSVNFEWILDTVHGADYFRRWHRYKENSGGLLVHKSTHHFDLMNWYLNQDPVAVNAFGGTKFYGKNGEKRGERCLTCQYKKECPYYFDIDSDDFMKKLYHDVEDVDGYYRDRCIFAEDITAEDSIALNIEYNKGTVVSYSLTTHTPYEGYRMCFNGTKGRMVVENFCRMIDTNHADEMTKKITIYNRLGEEIVYNYPINDTRLGGHGGGDIRLLNMIIRGGVEDPLGQQAGLHEGAMSIMIGIAGNVSMKENRRVTIEELMK
ncbi:MAG: Gfo/Idh/MocA family oxidoreductase [Clostridia bacterium]|nr:Gfo/Idh/MocA family oxidoreductase [Clostridia bacterium]